MHVVTVDSSVPSAYHPSRSPSDYATRTPPSFPRIGSIPNHLDVIVPFHRTRRFDACIPRLDVRFRSHPRQSWASYRSSTSIPRPWEPVDETIIRFMARSKEKRVESLHPIVFLLPTVTGSKASYLSHGDRSSVFAGSTPTCTPPPRSLGIERVGDQGARPSLAERRTKRKQRRPHPLSFLPMEGEASIRLLSLPF